MLRLKPSELTLTPEDIDETFQRMAQRRQARAAAAAAAAASHRGRARNSGRPLPPRLRPGAQRSVRDAITDLGIAPVLRPQPRQAIIAHVNDDSEESEEGRDIFHQAQGSPNSSSIPSQLGQLASASSAAAALVSRYSTALPLRLGRPESEPLSVPDEKTLVEPADSPVETTTVAGPATPGRSMPKGKSLVDSSPTLQSDPSATPASLRGGASRSQGDPILTVGQNLLHAPSPLRQIQVPGPAHQPDSDSASSDDGHPVRYLRGYFEISTRKYTFQELVPRAPHTEPIRRTNQAQTHSRSQSSTDGPPPHFFAPTPNAPRSSTGDDIFWSPTAPTTERSASMTDSRPRQQSSEMSNTSLAYSYYELPDTRSSSGELLVQGYDGVTHSREASLGTYCSVRLSDAQAFGDNVPRDPVSGPSSFASPTPILSASLSASPLPAEPYARPPAGSAGPRYQPVIQQQVNLESLGHEIHPNAVTAVMQNRVSPLEALTTHIGRESQRLEGYQGHQRGGQFAAGHMAHHSPAPVSGPYQSAYGPQSSAYGTQPFAYGPSPGAVGQPPVMPMGALTPHMAMADDPYTRGVSANAGRPYGPTARASSAQAVPVANTAAPLPRSTHGGRSSQRSSENAPVGSSAPRPRTGRRSQGQGQVAAFEQVNNAAQPR